MAAASSWANNFYPRPPRGGRLSSMAKILRSWLFLSTPSARRATCRSGRMPKSGTFLSTPSARRATAPVLGYKTAKRISIHALREEGDAKHYPKRHDHGISIHALREEGDGSDNLPKLPDSHFYPRPPRGGRLEDSWHWVLQRAISIHALREEGDLTTTPELCRSLNFYPRPPRGGRQSPTLPP